MSLFGVGTPAGALKLLGSASESCTTSGIEFKSLISSQFDEYVLKIAGTGDTSNDSLYLRISDDNGATYETTLYTYANTRHLANGAIGDDESAAATVLPLIIATADNDVYALKGFDLTVGFNRCLDPSLYTMVSWEGAFSNVTPDFCSVQGHGTNWGTTTMNAFQLLASSGTYSVTWSFYGRTK